MMNSQFREAVVNTAKTKFPNGFNIEQLITTRNGMYGGRTSYGTKSFAPIRTYEDVNDQLNAFAIEDGGYPLGMSVCEVVGISGNCGTGCPSFSDGSCEMEDPQGFISYHVFDEEDTDHFIYHWGNEDDGVYWHFPYFESILEDLLNPILGKLSEDGYQILDAMECFKQ
ncbi:MAG: hypothetical protein GY853_14455 [PVC group bacterium]|nr:hypothetical protein [PVC group bacterium]